MIEAINKVKGAVAKKDLLPILTHLHFYSGRVQGSNGKIVIDAPCPDASLNITVPLDPFVKALQACPGEPVLEVIGNNVRVTCGRFKADIAIDNSNLYPVMGPDLNPHSCGEFLEALIILEPFMGSDASRDWACGINLSHGFAYATNNVSLVKSAITFEGQANISSNTVNELVRLCNQPTGIAYGTNTATFHYDDGTWVKSQLIAKAWPDISGFFKRSENMLPVDKDLLDDIMRVIPFATKKTPTIKFCEDGIFVQGDNKEAEVTGYIFPTAFFRAEPLVEVLRVATEIDFSTYPKPCYFVGDGIEGVIIGCLG